MNKSAAEGGTGEEVDVPSTPVIVFTRDGERECSDAWTMMAPDFILTGDLSAEIVLPGIFVRKWLSFWLEERKRWGHHCSIPGNKQIPFFPE